MALPTMPVVVARDALTNAAYALTNMGSTSSPDQARAALDQATGMMERFSVSVQQACYAATQTFPGFSCGQAGVDARSALSIVQQTPCCFPNTAYLATIDGLGTMLTNLDSRFDSEWGQVTTHFNDTAFTAATASEQSFSITSLPSTGSQWSSLFEAVQSTIIKSLTFVWRTLVGKNINQPQTPWITATGKSVPQSIKWVWISLNITCCSLPNPNFYTVLKLSQGLPVMLLCQSGH